MYPWCRNREPKDSPRRSAVWPTLAVVVCAAQCGPAAAAPAVGQILSCEGAVQVRHGATTRAAALLHPLEPKDQVVAAKGGKAEVVLFANGRRFSIQGPGAARITATELVSISGKPPVGLKAVALPRLGEQPVPGRVLGLVVRGQPDIVSGPRRATPNGSVRAVPVLKWEGPVEGSELEVRVRDAQEVIEKASLPVSAREYRLPPDRLKPGEFYVWSVTSLSESGDVLQSTSGVVRVLTEADRHRLEALETSLQAEMSARPGDLAPLLLLGRSYEAFGLFDEALTQYRKALQARPRDSGLLGAVRRLGGETKPAPPTGKG